MVVDAEKRTNTLVSEAEDRLSKIRIERESVAGYFAALRSVIGDAEKATAED